MKLVWGIFLLGAFHLQAMPLLRIPVTNTWDAIGYPCNEVESQKLSNPSSQVCVRYFDKYVDVNGYVQSRSQIAWFLASQLSKYQGENLFPKPFSSTEYSMVGEFGDDVELLPIRLVGDDAFLCVATRDFRALNRGYTSDVRYFLVPIVFLRLSHGGYLHSSDLSDRIFKSYFVVGGKLSENILNAREAVISQFYIGDRLPDWEYFQSIFKESFQSRLRAEPKRSTFRNCVDWLLGRQT